MNEKLFVYGIFLNERHRKPFNMTNPKYAVVKDYATVPIGGTIVAAEPLKGYDLTGLIVDIDSTEWERLDRLEAGYKRIKVETSRGKAWMYIR